MRHRLVHPSWATLTPIVLCGALASLALASTPATAVAPRVVVATASPVPANVTVVAAPITTRFDVTLRVRDAAALTAYIAGLADPSSPDYRRFLTTSEFASRFGASQSSVASLRRYFSNFGLHVGSLSKGRVVLHVSGSTTAIAHAFSTSVVSVRRANGQLAAQFVAPATLPASIGSMVAGIGGFSSVIEPSSNLVRAHVSAHASIPSSCSSTTNPAQNLGGGYNVAQQATLYGLSAQWQAGHTGVGQTIGIYELGQYDPADVATFDQCYKITPNLSTVNVDNGPGPAFSDEATLDVEEAAALAPGANIIVYQGPQGQNGPLDVFQTMADQNVATVVSTSWGTCEDDQSNSPSAEVPIFEQMATQGQTVLSAAGDEGSSDCHGITGVAGQNQLAVDDPASQPLVTGVGGLTISSIAGPTESVWNTGAGTSNPGAGGGGKSILWKRPSWQNATGITGADTARLVPDLSVMGDPRTGFVMYYSGVASGQCTKNACGWQPVGGTSIGSPLVSALVVTAAQACGVGRLGFINPALYAMATSGFIDVTLGNNDLFSVGGYAAGVGYDMASGLGSPRPGTFFTGLCPTPFDTAHSSVSPTSLRATTGVPGAGLRASVRTSSGQAITNASVVVSAVGSSGTVKVDGDVASATGAGTATYDVTTDATGAASFTVTSSTPQVVTVTVTYQSQTVGTSSIAFAAPTAPGRASIAKLTALAAGFSLRVHAPSNTGGSAITRYQYSTNAGASWVTLARGATSATVAHLAKRHTYVVVVRAVNAVGPGPASARHLVRTKA